MKFIVFLFLVQCSFLFGGNKKEIEIVYVSMPTRSKLMLDNVVEKYNQENEEITVKVRVEPHNTYKEIYEDIEAGEGPDGFIMSDVTIKSAIVNNYIQPMNKYMTRRELKEIQKYTPENFIFENNIYGYKTGSKGMALYYNKKILEKYRIPKPKSPSDIPYLTKLAKEAGVIPLVNDSKISDLKHSYLDYLIKYHLDMEEQKLFVYSKDLGYANKYEAFFAGNIAFMVGNIEDVHYSDFYRNIYGMFPLMKIDENIFTMAYVLQKNTKYPNETMDFFRYMYKATSTHNNNII